MQRCIPGAAIPTSRRDFACFPEQPAGGSDGVAKPQERAGESAVAREGDGGRREDPSRHLAAEEATHVTPPVTDGAAGGPGAKDLTFRDLGVTEWLGNVLQSLAMTRPTQVCICCRRPGMHCECRLLQAGV